MKSEQKKKGKICPRKKGERREWGGGGGGGGRRRRRFGKMKLNQPGIKVKLVIIIIHTYIFSFKSFLVLLNINHDEPDYENRLFSTFGCIQSLATFLAPGFPETFTEVFQVLYHVVATSYARSCASSHDLDHIQGQRATSKSKRHLKFLFCFCCYFLLAFHWIIV